MKNEMINGVNRYNLKKLSDYLKGPLRAEFHMEDYGMSGIADTAMSCGTVGCAVGHGPFAGIDKIRGECWRDYSRRVFVDDDLDSDTDNTWDWLFDGSWIDTDNTSKGAAARIDWYLTHGVPGDYLSQTIGTAKLCYK